MRPAYSKELGPPPTINLVGNNFPAAPPFRSSLPWGLGCVHRNFCCGSIFSSFAIKCGGPPIRSSNQRYFDREDETVGPAIHFMVSTGSWAVSNTGLPSDNPDPNFMSFSSSQFTNTLDSELFQTARIFTGPLRSYGLGLDNGNYTVNLQYTESQILNPPTWRSLGRHVFDGYVQREFGN